MKKTPAGNADRLIFLYKVVNPWKIQAGEHWRPP